MSIFFLRISMHCMTCSLTARDLISDNRAAFSIILIGNQIADFVRPLVRFLIMT